MISVKSSLLLISKLDVDIVKISANIQFGKILSILKLKNKWIFVLDCYNIDCPIVLYQLKKTSVAIEDLELLVWIFLVRKVSSSNCFVDDSR